MQTQLLRPRGMSVRPVRAGPRISRARAQPVVALFGFGGKKEKSWRQVEKEDQWRIQQEIIEKRRTGEAIKEANDRRAKVAETLSDRKAARRSEKEALAKGEMPDSLKNWKPYKSKMDEQATSGIVVPLLPFGINKYDEGERFDLRSPYAEEGWVDPNETNIFESFKNIGTKLLNFGGANKKINESAGKPIIWASQWEKQQAEKKGKGKN